MTGRRTHSDRRAEGGLRAHYLRGLPFLLGEAAVPGGGAPPSTQHMLASGQVLWSTEGREAEGVQWLQQAAQAQCAEALYFLGLASLRGQGTPCDEGESRRLQLAAARLGVVDAQFELSLLLQQGIGGPKDPRGAARWEAKAAEAGHARASLNRGARVASRKRPDFAGAARWYERAAGAGNAEAAARLCKMRLAGQGVPRDEKVARRWFERAAALGYDWSPQS